MWIRQEDSNLVTASFLYFFMGGVKVVMVTVYGHFFNSVFFALVEHRHDVHDKVYNVELKIIWMKMLFDEDEMGKSFNRGKTLVTRNRLKNP